MKLNDQGFLRLAEAVVHDLEDEPESPEEAKQLKQLTRDLGEAERVIPPSLWTQLRRAFTPAGLPFFEFYVEMMKISLGGPVTPGLKTRYKRAADRIGMVRSPVDKSVLSPTAVNAIALTRPLVYRTIGRIERDQMTPMYWGQFNAVFVPLLVQVARDKRVFLKPSRQTGIERWAYFRKMSPKQERIELLRDEDPESFALMEKLGQTMEEIDANIEASITEQGKEVRKGFLAGRPVLLGVDPATGEEMVHDRDGTVVPKDEFFDKVRAKSEALSRLSRVPDRTVVPPQELRLLTDEDLAQLVGAQEWDAITDDKAKQGRLTRLFPTKRTRKFIADPKNGIRIEEYKVVTEGRYKGVFLDDLINSQGRLIEGTVYTYDVKKGRESKIPKVIDPSEREPYVTVAEVVSRRTFQGKKITVKTKKLYIKIDGTRQNAVLRNALKQLACNAGTQRGCVPSITYEAVEGSRAAGFYFDPKDFGLIMDSLQGMSLSTAALDEVKRYYKELARAESATKNLDAYEPEALASENEDGEQFQFVKGHFDRDGDWQAFGLREKQKEALAWMDANGNSGVCALETGVGKTAVSIGMMMKLVRDGLAEPDSSYTRPDGTTIQTNGRFLFVCPTSLRGNIKKELRALLSDPKVMLDRVDVLSYRQFSGASKSGNIPDSLRSIPFWKARATAMSPKTKQAGHKEVGEYKGLVAYWEFNSPHERVYGVYNREMDQDVGRLLFDRRTRTWEVQDAHDKRIETYTASNDQDGVKRGLMTLAARPGMRLAATYTSAKAWDAALYAAIFFDEAQEMKNPSSGSSQAALKLHHPRKICLTASPMERNPMEAYVLAAITNNTPLFGNSLEAKGNRQEMRRFKERFCEVVGGRIVGIKQDPLVQRDLHTWVKRNVFYADKTDVKEYRLPKPTVTATPVEMPHEVEAIYRDVASGFAAVMQGAARKFVERKRTDPYEDRQAEKLFSRALAPVIKLMTDMANRPAKALQDVAFAVEKGYLPDFVDKEGNPRPLPKNFVLLLKKWQERMSPEDIRGMAAQVGNPKIKAAEETIYAKLERAEGSRALLFSDDREMCMEAGQHLAKTMAGTHVVALNDAIYFFRGGQELDRLVYPLDTGLLGRLVKDPEERKRIMAETGGVSELKLPFHQKSYKKHPALPGKQGVHTAYQASEWQQFVLKEIVAPDPSIHTCTLLGKTYMYGHNLQAFNTVIHLDRDSWNSESMKQRTARAWRQGQDQVVDEVTLDFTYRGDDGGVPRSPNDITLDEIRKVFQEMDAAIFDRIIKDAQTIALGAEWEGVKKRDASLWRLNDRVVEMMASPMLERV